ncbi:MAG: BTAD domain-containing putative transcriptional regulator [Gemmatimonadota bacterium]
MQLELQTLGSVGLRSRDGGASIAQIVQPKRLALLVYLALAPRRRCRRRDQIVSLFWPELDTDHARGALSQALRYLRRSIGETVVITQGEEDVGIDGAMIWCDAAAFKQHCDSHEFERALGLYKGRFMEGSFVSDASPEYDQWVEDERNHLRQLALDATLRLGEVALASGDVGAALDWARRAWAIAPGDEPVSARLIELLDQSGDRAGALRTYEVFRQRLKTEFEVAPSHETQALIARILAR